ncbi:MAG: hypothetical protein GXY44_00695 [Phycisphaerales bacterium]|nr:hypothetical protein [Phycisphaerales bacterium]
MAAAQDLMPADQPVVRANGIGRSPDRYRGVRARLMAERAARIVATRNLLAKITWAETPCPQSGHRRIEGRLSGVRYLPTVFHPDGSAEVIAEVSRHGHP